MTERHAEDCVCNGTSFRFREIIGLASGDTIEVSDNRGRIFRVRAAHIGPHGAPVSCGLPFTVYLEVPCRDYERQQRR
jgi:hypothetical protein